MTSTSVTASFQNLNEGYSDGMLGMELQEDGRDTIAKVDILPGGGQVAVLNKKYIRLYAHRNIAPEVQVVPVTGSITYVSKQTEGGQISALAFSPDSMVQGLPPGHKEPSLIQVGKAFDEDGKVTVVSFLYDALTGQVRVSKPAYCICKATYDREYRLFLYEFGGVCPLKYTEGATLESGAIYGLYSSGSIQRNSSLNISPPECKYGYPVFDPNDTASQRKLPSISMSMDPDGAPRLVANSDGSLYAECLFRLYANGESASVMSTSSGWVWPTGVVKAESVTDTLTFQNQASSSLSKHPAGSVGIEQLLYISGGNAYVGPGMMVTDAKPVPGDSKAYTDPVRRTVGYTEVVSTNGFIVTNSFSIIKAMYSSHSVLYKFRFAYDNELKEFIPAHVYAGMSDGRATTMQLTPPSMKSVSRSLL